MVWYKGKCGCIYRESRASQGSEFNRTRTRGLKAVFGSSSVASGSTRNTVMPCQPNGVQAEPRTRNTSFSMCFPLF